MTDTDKLKRLAEAAKRVHRDANGRLDGDDADTIWFGFLDVVSNPDTILALIAENDERKRECEAVQVLVDKAIAVSFERDEAVALLRRAADENERLKEEIEKWKRLKGMCQEQIEVERRAYRSLLADYEGRRPRIDADK